MNDEPELRRLEQEIARLAADACVGGIDHTFIGTYRDESGGVVIRCNRFGMMRLAMQLLSLARGQPGTHLHFDDSSELTHCDVPMTIARSADD